LKGKRGQVWIETVLYTLIGLALIGLVLAFVVPRINVQRDNILVEQTVDSLNILDEKINAVLDGGAENRRIVEFGIRRGSLHFNAESEDITFILEDLDKPYSEPGVEINFGKIKIVSEEGQRKSSVRLILDYANSADLTFSGVNENKKFDAASVLIDSLLRIREEVI